MIESVPIRGTEEERVGNLGRDVLTGPGFSNTDFSILKNTRLPTGDFGSSRQVQFALKLIF